MTVTLENPMRQPSDDTTAIEEVVSRYYEVFARDSAAAAAFYGEPSLIVLQDELLYLPTRTEVEGFLTKGLDSLKALGYSGTKMSASRIKFLNLTTAFYGTIAIRMRSDGTELQRAAFTYLLHKGETGWKIHQLIATDIDKLISSD